MSSKHRIPFNRGEWEIQRERFRITDESPPLSFHPTPVGDIIARLFKDMDRKPELAEQDILESWRKSVDSRTAQHAWPARLQKGTLTIYVDHSVWLAETSRNKHTILKALQEALGSQHLQRVRFQLDPDQENKGRGEI